MLARDAYFAHLWEAATGRELLFFDPDNGFEVASVTRGGRNSSKYFYWDEAADAYLRGFSLVVYQHFPRVRRQVFLERVVERIEEATGSSRVMALVTSHVAFFVVPRPRDVDALGERLRLFSLNTRGLATLLVRPDERY